MLDGNITHPVRGCLISKHKISNTEKEWRVRTREERSCHTPELGTIPSEGKITAYESLSVSPSAKCKSEQRVCDDGVLSGSFKFRECVIAIDDRCYDAPWGKLEKGIDPGRIIVAYQKETVPFGETCAFEKQICQNGKFSGTYTHEKCIIEEPKSCTDDVWGEVKHGETRPVYKYAERQPGDSTCARNQKTVSCENGVMTSVKGYKNKECTDIQAKMCDSPCGQIEHGKTCMAFRDCGDYESRVCNNGKLSGSYELRYPNCQSCLMPWGERVSHGSVRIAYKDDSVASLKECRNRKITCDNGVVNDHGYQFRTCTPDAK